MVAGVRRRLALLYAAIFAATLLLLGPVLYLSFAHQLAEASDVTLRLAAQREAARAFTPAGPTGRQRCRRRVRKAASSAPCPRVTRATSGCSPCRSCGALTWSPCCRRATPCPPWPLRSAACCSSSWG